MDQEVLASLFKGVLRMGLLLTLVQYLVRLGVCSGDGDDCFRDFMPEAPDNVVVLHEYSGDALSPYTQSVHRSVQVKVRNSDAEAARAKAVEVCRAFSTTAEDYRIDFSDTHWGQVYIRQIPFKLSQDESGRTVYCFNLGITTTIME